MGTVGGSYSYGAGSAGPHAVTSVPGNTYGYNARGDQITRSIGGQTTNLTYDHQGRLVALSGAQTASYRYDTTGKRAVVTSGGVTRWIVDEVYTAGSDGTEEVSYRFGSQTVATSAGTTTGDNTLTVYTAGQLGSLEAQVTSTGTVTWQAYTPFGTPAPPQGPAFWPVIVATPTRSTTAPA